MAGPRGLRNRQSEEAQSIRSLRAHLASGQYPEEKKKQKEEKEIITLFGVKFQKGRPLTGTAPVGGGSRKERCLLSFFN